MKHPIASQLVTLLAAAAALLCKPAAATQDSAGPIYTYDLTYTVSLDAKKPEMARKIWDETHFITTIQGIVNRDKPELYLFLVGGNTATVDRFWLNTLRAPGAWLANRTATPLPNLDSLINKFKSRINGLVVYDDRVPATSNVASTAAGVEDLAAVRYDPSPDSLYTHLTAPSGLHLPVKLWLVHPDGSSMFTGKGHLPGSATPSSGSAKCDAYLWAKERYLDTGKCAGTRLAYYLDSWWIAHPDGYIPNHTLTDHDFFISQRGFFFDLLPWDDETPVDDPSQPKGTDQATLRAILKSAWLQTGGRKMIHVGGFVPWAWKYTDYTGAGGKHGGVPTEWKYAHILSCFNAYMDADALGICAMANASVYTHFPLASHYPQQKPTVNDLKKRGLISADGHLAPKSYVAIYGGDYDAASWLYQRLPDIWNDPARGTIPVGWAFNPNLADRFAAGMDWARKNARPGDTFTAGDSGAGYLNPGSLTPPREYSGLKSGLETWRQHCVRYFNQWDLSITGFVIDGDAPGMTPEIRKAYTTFSADGVVAQKVPRIGMEGDTPFLRMETDLNDPISGAASILAHCRPEKPEFLVCRTILWSPTDLKKMMDRVHASETGSEIEFVDPYTLMLLAKQFQQGPDQGAAKAQPLPQPKPGQKANLWNLRYGAKVTNHSAMLPGSDPRDLFGGSYGSLESHDLILFADGKPEGFVHSVEWETRGAVRLHGYRIKAHGDENTGRREFGTFRLFSRVGPGSDWTFIDTFDNTHPYAMENAAEDILRTRTLNAPVNARQFRAEFVQGRAPDGTVAGPRVIELEAIAELTGGN